MKNFCVFLVLDIVLCSILFSCSCRNDGVGIRKADISEPEVSLSSSVAALDSLSGLLMEEYRKYDLPHFNSGVKKMGKRMEAVFCVSNKDAVDYSFGMLFCCLGIESTAITLKDGAKKALASNEIDFGHPLPCTFEEYFKKETPTCELFEKYCRRCVEAGEFEYFWKFQYAFHSEAEFLVSQDPKNVLAAASDEQYQSFVRKCRICREAIELLSRENPKYASLLEYRQTQADRLGLENNKSFPCVAEAIAGYTKYSMYFRIISHNLLTR